MFKNMIKGLSVFVGLIFIIGCASKGVEVRRYVEVTDRVDQDMEGNAGYLAGDPQPEDRSDIRKTRKIYVLEVSQGDAPEKTIVEEAVEEGMEDGSAVAEDMNFGSDNFIEVSRDSGIPYVDDGSDNDDIQATSSFTEYTVEKDDTLQKISKKFYDSYSKWPKIYEVNKDVIENPDRIKPGIVIQIPVE